MGLRDDFLTALWGGEQYDALLALVHHHQAQGLPPQEAYEILHQIWLEFGFDKIEEGSRLQADLEIAAYASTWIVTFCVPCGFPSDVEPARG